MANRLPIFFTIFLFPLACNKMPTQPASHLVIAGDPIQLRYRVPAESLVIDTSSVFSIHINQLTPIPAYSVSNADHVGDWRSLPKSEWNYIKKGFVKSVFDSFTVELHGCINQTQWFLREIDSNVTCLKRDSIAETDSSFAMKWHFFTLKSGKGILRFSYNSFSLKTADYPDLLIGYSINPLDSVWVTLDKIWWIFDTSQLSSGVTLALQGKTNAMFLSLQAYGDGVFNQPYIAIDSAGAFSDTINIAFIVGGSRIILASTQLFVNGTVGIPPSILLKNPLDTR